MNFIFKNSSIYLLANILNAAVPFILLPIVTRYFTVEEYGQLAMFQLLITGLSAFVGLNAVSSASRKFYDSNVSKYEFSLFITSCIWILFFSSAVLCFCFVVFSFEISQLLNISINWIYLALLFSFSMFFIHLRLSQWQIRGKAKAYGFLQVGSSTLNLMISLLLVVSFTRGVEGRIESQIGVAVITSIIALYLLKKDKLILLTPPNKNDVYAALNYGVPLIPHVFGVFLLSTIDRFYISESLGLESAGIYLLAVQLSTSFLIVFDAINKSFAPYLYSTLKEGNISKKINIVRYTYMYFILLIIIAGVCFVISPGILVFIAGDKFKDAGEVISWLLLGQIFGGMYLMVTNYIFYSKDTKVLSFITIVCGLTNVALLIYLIPILGILGAAYSFCISMLFRFILTWLLAIKKVDMPWAECASSKFF